VEERGSIAMTGEQINTEAFKRKRVLNRNDSAPSFIDLAMSCFLLCFKQVREDEVKLTARQLLPPKEKVYFK
jgi:hypothetical protein